MIFSQKFTIHPVGQGLFYSGTFKTISGVKFRMVFDCGNRQDKNAANEEVNLYRDTSFINDGILDLLIISHFDEDHVSHIENLLEGGIKVKKLIMPFITFQERLFLVLRIIGLSKESNPNNNFTINFILDPLGTLKDNLDNESEIYLIDSDDSDEPIPPLTEDGNKEDIDLKEIERFIFGFEGKSEIAELQTNHFTSTENTKTFKVNHKHKGTLKTFLGFKLMEFLFYKRNIGQGDKDFFDKIEELFNVKYNIQKELELRDKLANIVQAIKSIKSFNGSPLKDFFTEAKKQIKSNKQSTEPIKPKTGNQHLNILNPNTTSLCLLHKNLISISKFNRKVELCFCEIIQIQKFNTHQNRVNKHYHFINREEPNFPNVLLTSDTFLLKDVQVDPFLKHFQNYWNDFWLFQIPHHGSKKNSNTLLHSRIPSRTYNFINYGIPNKDKHPDQSVINDLVATGNSVRLIPVTQYQGLYFELTYP